MCRLGKLRLKLQLYLDFLVMHFVAERLPMASMLHLKLVLVEN